MQEELINDIIASINRIKNNMSSEINANETKLNEAIILNVPQNELSNTKANENYNKTGYNTTFIKSGIEDKFDMHPLINATNKYNINKTNISTTSKPDYVEILTIEPNTSNNTTQHNIIEVLKHLMPMLNSSNNKELHSVTIIERNHSKNHSISETKNISTLVLKYCDKGNMTAVTDEKLTDDDSGVDYSNKELPVIDQDNFEDDYDIDKENSEYNDKPVASNLTNKNKDILEAAEYGMQKMHELYSVLEPKLYSMGECLTRVSNTQTFSKFHENQVVFYDFSNQFIITVNFKTYQCVRYLNTILIIDILLRAMVRRYQPGSLFGSIQCTIRRLRQIYSLRLRYSTSSY